MQHDRIDNKQNALAAQEKRSAADLWPEWTAMQEEWVRLELRIRAAHQAFGLGGRGVISEEESALAGTAALYDAQEALCKRCDGLHELMLALPIRDADDAAALIDVALENEINFFEEFPDDRRFTDRVVFAVQSLARSVKIGAYRRRALLDAPCDIFDVPAAALRERDAENAGFI